jgi:hypothetical protein
MDWNIKARLFRERFYGRQDVYGRLWEIRRDGKELHGYAPVCDNRWQDFCHLKNKSAIPCSSCEHQKWTPVSDESVISHIQGEEAHIYYVLLPNSTIRFGAIDFDMKEGKEDKGYDFQDVSRTSNILGELGVSHHIARSTGRGYHLYIFFDRPYPANKFRSFILDIFDRAGFIDLVQQGIKPLPEYFPKQSYTSRDGIGNGIKPPMVEPRFKLGRNCWVDAEDRPIGSETPFEDQIIAAQWNYFANIIPQSTEDFDRILEGQGIEIVEEVHSGVTSTGGTRRRSRRDQQDSTWQQPLAGAVEKVLEGCAALRKVRDKTLRKETLGHAEGFGLFHICMNTRDGRTWFEQNVHGWGDNQSDLRQLDHSIEKNYMPWSCKKLQESGICMAGTQCFEKKPPREVVDGMEVLRSDLPKDLWPEPSPIRYAYGRGEDYLLKLQAEVAALRTVGDDDTKMNKLKDIVKRMQVFDEGQQKELKAYIREQKPLKRNELSKVFNEVAETYEEESKKAIKTRADVVTVDDNCYIKEEYGYTFIKSVKEGRTKQVKLCSIDIVLQEEVNYYEEEKDVKSLYHGYVRAPGIEKPFVINADDWCDVNMFFAFFTKLVGTRFSPLRQNLELIRQAAVGFSEKSGVKCSVHLQTQGYYGDTYLMPSCIIDENGVRPNTTQHVDLRGKETKYLDFLLLGDSEVKDVLMHLKTEFLTTWPELWTYIGIAHTLMPVVMPPMGWTKRTTLFYEGLTGTGKSELTHTLQYFWGQFDAIANFMSSPKGIRELGYQFKDANIVVDDYKGLTREQTSAVRETILNAYDGTVGYKLTRTSEMQTGKAVRGIYTMSGEEFITNDSAVIARTILIEVNRHNTQLTQKKYASVQKTRHLYSGITPQFISWFLRQDKKGVQTHANAAKDALKEGFYGSQNIDRIAINLAANYTVWALFTQFLVDMGAASSSEKEQMDHKHWAQIQGLRDTMSERCAAEQASEVFLRVLAQMLKAGEVSIGDLPKYTHAYKTTVGYAPSKQPEGGAIHLYPDVVFEAVKNFAKNQPIHGTKSSIGRQLDDQGYLVEKDKSRLTKNVRDLSGHVRIWAIKPEAIGIDPNFLLARDDSPTEPREGKVIEFRKAMNATEEDLQLF